MEREKRNLWKWLALLVVVFTLSLPAAAKECRAAGAIYRVRVDQGYLALRSAKAYDDRNEIGKLYTNDTVELYDGSDSTYWYVYSPKLGGYGYVNKDYLEADSNDVEYWTVHVDSGYLALRSAKAYDSRNEIAELYTGDAVEVLDTRDSAYWYVYVPKFDLNGYVNKDYLAAPAARASAFYWKVRVDRGYLALRSAKAYDDRNEIGQLYTGDAVEVLDSSDSAYWKVYSVKLDKTGYVNKDYLEYVSSGNSRWSVYVESGYLALRSAKAYDERNEIGQLYTGDTVELSDSSDSAYWYVYAPKLNKFGYVNKDYLVYSAGKTRSAYRTVRVDSGYLALRYAKAYDSSNEIGQLYTGDVVEVRDSSDAAYWYVYAPKLGMFGYVNKDYLY